MKENFLRKSPLLSLLIITFCLFLSGCTDTVDYIFEEEDKDFVEEITLIATPHVNYGMPLRVDVVVVKNDKVAEQLSRLTSKQYMKQRKQLKSDHPQEIKIRSFELTPGTSAIVPLPYTKKEVESVFVFADYNNQKQNRWKIFAAECVVVKLLENTATITSHRWKDRKTVEQPIKDNDMIILSPSS